MNKIKVKLFFAKNGMWIYPILGLISIIAIIYLYNRLDIDILGNVGKWSSETIAVLGTLLGAVIGGAFTLWGSIYINKKQLKAQTYIKRKNVIYKPLYDELCDIQFNILTANPYPRRIAFEIEEHGSWKYPQYTVWNRIKSDTRYLETPKIIVSEMENLYLKIDEYMKARIGDNEEMTNLTNGILQEVIGTQSTLMNLGDCVIKYALENSQQDIYEYCKISLKEKVDVTDEQHNKINSLFYERCKESPVVIKIKKAKQELEQQQKKVIDLLTELIQYVNIKYEG
ncbi:MAG: hypothetical protein IJN42_03420 [Clostridia bacterium]|nr:hypothetical protein [Clostridia bacterium]